MTDKPDGVQRLRVVLEFQRVDQPRLFDDLMRFPKGVRRVNRLRFLAHDGLVLELQQGFSPLAMPSVPRHPAALGHGLDVSVTDDIFRHEDR